jgi:2-methylisocitrate lyase-like PEP mutase family enzyme
MTATTAEIFHRLHDGPSVLLLPNCWDAASARLLESLGAQAIATTSAGLAWSCGYPDGDALPVRELANAVAAITRVLGVPLSVDMEGGYSDDPHRVGEAVRVVCDAGAVGINLEDGADSPDLFARKIEQARHAADVSGVVLFINARTDVVLRSLVPEEQHVRESLRRAATYRDAGADGFFVPKIVDENGIREIAAGCAMPLNVLAWPGLPLAPRLAELGVRRLTSGSAIAAAALGRARAVATDFLRDGSSASLFEAPMPYGEMNALFTPK